MTLYRGVLCAVAAAALFGLSTPFAKMLVGESSPLLLAGCLYLGSGLGLALVIGVRAVISGATIVRPRGTDLFWLLGAIGCGGVIGPYLLLYGLRASDAASASLILNLEGVFTALLAWFAFRENFDRRIAFGMALIVAGGLVLSTGGALRASGFIGPVAIAGACLAWAIDNNLTRKVAANDAMFIACCKGLVAGSVSLIIALKLGASLPPAIELMKAGVLGFVAYGLSLTLFVIGLRDLGTARTGAYFSLAPFLGAALAVGLGAPVTAPLLIAGGLMAAGVWLHLTERHSHKHRHERLSHEHSHIHDAHHQHIHDPGTPAAEPHSHPHVHEPLEHTHEHYPDVHHRHEH